MHFLSSCSALILQWKYVTNFELRYDPILNKAAVLISLPSLLSSYWALNVDRKIFSASVILKTCKDLSIISDAWPALQTSLFYWNLKISNVLSFRGLILSSSPLSHILCCFVSGCVCVLFWEMTFFFWFLVARTCNLILIVLDVLKPLGHKKIIENELEGFGIRLNSKPPNIGFKKKDKGGINLTATVS